MLPSNPRNDLVQLCILTAPSFNLAATTAFVDPFRVANYLYGRRYVWAFQSFWWRPAAGFQYRRVENQLA